LSDAVRTYTNDLTHVRLSELVGIVESVMMATFAEEGVSLHAASVARVGVVNLDVQVRDATSDYPRLASCMYLPPTSYNMVDPLTRHE
jgi:hypothetical protein